jgi:hypothetical protein
MNSNKFFLPFLVAFIFIAFPMKFLDLKPGGQGTRIDFPPPPHLEPKPNQAQKINQIVHPDRTINPLVSNNVITNTLGTGDDQIHGLIYDNASLWASTRTKPARILRINPANLTVENRIILNSGQDEADDIAAGQGYVWTITYTNPAQLIRVDPATNTAQTAIAFQSSELGYATSLKYAFGYLWMGGINHLVKINISSPLAPTYTVNDFSPVATDGYVLISALTASNDHLWGIFEQYSLSQSKFFASTIIKIDPSTPTIGYVTNTVPTLLFPDDVTYLVNHFYASSENQPVQTSPSYLYEFDDNLSIHSSTQVSDHASYGTFLDPYELTSFWGVYVNSPGRIIKFDLNGVALANVTLPHGFNDPGEMAFDAAGNMYVTTWQSPAGIVKYTFKVFYNINLPLIVRNKSQ